MEKSRLPRSQHPSLIAYCVDSTSHQFGNAGLDVFNGQLVQHEQACKDTGVLFGRASLLTQLPVDVLNAAVGYKRHKQDSHIMFLFSLNYQKCNCRACALTVAEDAVPGVHMVAPYLRPQLPKQSRGYVQHLRGSFKHEGDAVNETLSFRVDVVQKQTQTLPVKHRAHSCRDTGDIGEIDQVLERGRKQRWPSRPC